MKKQALRRFLIGSLVAAFAVVAAYGQQAPTLMINIPSEFVAGNTTFPAGQYTIKPASAGNPSPTLLLRRADGPQAAMCMTRGVETRDAQETSKLLFRRYGDQYFLYQVWSVGRSRGHEVLKSRLEQELAMNEVKPQLASIIIEKPAVKGGKSQADGSHRPSK